MLYKAEGKKTKQKNPKIKYVLDPVESKSVKVSLLNDDFQKMWRLLKLLDL